MNDAHKRPRFRDQSIAGILWSLLLAVMRSSTREGATVRQEANGADATAPGPHRASLPSPALIGLGAAFLIGFLIASGIVLVNLYHVTDLSGLQASATPAPTVVPTTPPLVLGHRTLLSPINTYTGGTRAGSQLLQPQDAVRGADGRIYVADTGNHRVAILDASGKFVGAITGGASGALQMPYSLAETTTGHVMVLDSDAGRVFEYDSAGKLLHSSDPSLSLGHARGIALDPAGHVLVANPASNTVEVLGSDLTLIHQQPAMTAGKATLFNQPSAVGVGPDGSIFVVDSQNSKLEQFSSDWQLIASWPIIVSDTQHSPRVVPLPGGRVLVSDPRDGTLLLFSNGSPQPQVFDVPATLGSPIPLGISIDRAGRVLVTCAGANAIMEVRVPGI